MVRGKCPGDWTSSEGIPSSTHYLASISVNYRHSRHVPAILSARIGAEMGRRAITEDESLPQSESSELPAFLSTFLVCKTDKDSESNDFQINTFVATVWPCLNMILTQEHNLCMGVCRDDPNINLIVAVEKCKPRVDVRKCPCIQPTICYVQTNSEYHAKSSWFVSVARD